MWLMWMKKNNFKIFYFIWVLLLQPVLGAYSFFLSGTTPGSVQGTICGIRDDERISHM